MSNSPEKEIECEQGGGHHLSLSPRPPAAGCGIVRGSGRLLGSPSITSHSQNILRIETFHTNSFLKGFGLRYKCRSKWYPYPSFVFTKLKYLAP